MPLIDDDFLQQSTGHGTGTSVAVSLPAGTTAGMTVLVFIYAGTTNGVTGVASGFISDGGRMYRRSNVGAGETGPWTFTLALSGNWAYYAMEVDNLDLTDPFDGTETVASSGTTNNGATRSTNTTLAATGSEGVAFAFFLANKAASGDVQSWAGYTNSFSEVLESAPAGTGWQIAVARKYISGFVTHQTTATFTTSVASATTQGTIVTYRSAQASINAPLAYLTGFEFGTHGGWGNAGVPPAAGSPTGDAASSGAGQLGTTILVQAGSARNGGYGLRLTPSASSAQVPFSNAEVGAGVSRLAVGFNIRPVSASGVVVMAALVTSSGTNLELVYDATTEKLGLRWTGGTASYQTGTTPLNAWAWVDIRFIGNAPYHADWSIETGTGDGSQTSPSDPAAGSASSVYLLLGAVSTATFTADYDDVVISRHVVAHPLGPHVVRILAPETTGATVSGTAANFKRFTSNGTLTAPDGTEGALLDDIPPTVSASSDGVVQVTAAASDYIQIPMTTYTLAADEVIAGVRAFASLWGGTGTGTGTLGFRGHDGTAETTFVAASTSFDPDSLTAISATYPLWYTAIWGVGTAWNQTKLNAAALRGGFSTDATPDMGFSCMGLEVATRTVPTPVVVHRLTDDEDPEAVAAVVTEQLHPYNSAVRTFTVSNNHHTRTAEFRFYESGGAEHASSPVVVAPTDPPVDLPIAAEAFGQIESTTFGWQ